MQVISSDGILPRNVHLMEGILHYRLQAEAYATQESRDTEWRELSSMVSFAFMGVVIKVRDATANGYLSCQCLSLARPHLPRVASGLGSGHEGPFLTEG